MGIKLLWVVVAFFFAIDVDANTYAIFLKDKSNTLYSIEHPSAFLSERALARRQRFHIPITALDIPVSTSYLDEINRFPIELKYSLKWLNCIVVNTDPSVIQQINTLPFVSYSREIAQEGKYVYKTESKFEVLMETANTDFAPTTYYASSNVQNTMIHVDFLHAKGFKGDNVLVAHFDNGCFGAKTIKGFDSLFTTNRYVGAKDIVDGDDNIFNDGSHGTATLSCIAANEPGKMVGTSPNALFYLLRTENNNSETIQEEYNWAYGAEVADSIGADVFTTSLGYTTFDGGFQNHTYADLNGNKTPITVAANIAARLGIIVVNSAGNEGSKPWHYIAAPADGDSVLAVGAVDGNRQFADFSGFGPNSSGRLKPDVCAMGKGTSVYNTSGVVYASNGTSFSGPVMAGGAVCLRQAYPLVSNLILLDVIRKSAHLFKNPNDSLGYGIPDLAVAYFLLDEYVRNQPENRTINTAFPNPFNKGLSIYLQQPNETQLSIELYDYSGRLVLTQSVHLENNQSQYLTLDAESINAGVYLLRVKGQKYYDIQRVEKR